MARSSGVTQTQYEHTGSPLLLKVIASASVLLFVVLNLVTYWQMTERVTSALRSDIENRSFVAALAIEEYFEGKKKLVCLMADLSTVKTYLTNAKQDSVATTVGYVEIQDLLKSASGTDKHSAIAWIASDLDEFSFSYDVVTTSKEEWKTNERPWYEPTMQMVQTEQTDGVYVSDPYVDIETNDIGFSIIKKVEDEGKVVGFVGIDFFFPPIKEIMGGFIEPRISSYPILVSDNGTILYRPDAASFARNIRVFSSHLSDISPSLQQVFDKSKEQNVAEALLVPIREEIHYVGISPISKTNLSVLIICPRAAYEQSSANFLHTLLSATLFNVLLLLLPIILFLWVAMRRRNQFLNIKQLYNVVVNRMKVGVAVVSPDTGYCDLMNEAYLSFLEMKPTRRLFFPDVVRAKFQVNDSNGPLFTITGKRRSHRGQPNVIDAQTHHRSQPQETSGVDATNESTIYPGVSTSQFTSSDTILSNGLDSAMLAQTAIPESIPSSSTWQMMQLPEFSEVTVKTSWGERMFMHHITSFQDHSGRPRLLSVLTDITELKAAQNSLRESRDTARAISLAKSVFMANMSQEIQNQLNGVLGMTERLSESQLDDAQLQYIDIMRISSSSLLKVINNILTYSKIEAGLVKVNVSDFDLYQLIDGCCFTAELESKKKGIAFERYVNQDVPRMVKGDSVRIQYMLRNMLENACKFTTHGKVSLRVTTLHVQWQKLPHCCFEVEDTGVGISEEKRQLLFYPFMQSDNSTARKFGGTGLELAIMKKLVDLMGGKISCRSGLKKGSVFTFNLPLHPSEKTRLNTISSSTEPRHLRLLLVDDVNSNLIVLSSIVQQQGHSVEMCSNGREALEALSRNDYDLVLMDCGMPELDGYECTRIVRDPQSDVRNHKIPIIAVTANTLQGDDARCFEAGMDDYIANPISPNILLKKLSIWGGKIARNSTVTMEN